jgi:RNA polymerase sigma factor (sigma-70 family)
MHAPDSDRLSQISTNWQELFASRSTPSESARASQHALVLRYCGAVYHYLLAATRDIHAADDLAQEFALRFVRGDYGRADPTKGRFRDYIKSALYHLVVDHFRARQRRPLSLPDEDLLPAPEAEDSSTDALFLAHWRQEILNRTWQELQKADGVGLFVVLRWKANTPDGKAADGARELTTLLQREITPAGFRQTLHRAREKFAELMRQEIAHTLGTTDPGAVELELAELKLIDYCRPMPSRPSSRAG